MANMTGRDPYSERLSLRDAMNRLFEESFVNPSTLAQRQGFNMAVDLSETDDAFVVDAVVPGVKPEDVNITLENNVLTITGETKQEKRADGEQGNYHQVERRYGRFTRAIALPAQITADQVQATLENGILRIQIPKADEVKPRRISVSSAQNGQKQMVDTQAKRQSQPARGS